MSPENKEPRIVGQFHKNPGWIIEKDGSFYDDILNPEETTAKFTKRKIKELRKKGVKIPYTIADYDAD